MRSSIKAVSEKRNLQYLRDYKWLCEVAKVSPYPFRFLTLARYLMACFLASSTFCTSTLSSRLSGLKWCAQVELVVDWVDSASQARLSRLIQGLKKLSPHLFRPTSHSYGSRSHPKNRGWLWRLAFFARPPVVRSSQAFVGQLGCTG